MAPIEGLTINGKQFLALLCQILIKFQPNFASPNPEQFSTLNSKSHAFVWDDLGPLFGHVPGVES